MVVYWVLLHRVGHVSNRDFPFNFMIGVPARDTINNITIRTSISTGLVTCSARYSMARIAQRAPRLSLAPVALVTTARGH